MGSAFPGDRRGEYATGGAASQDAAKLNMGMNQNRNASFARKPLSDLKAIVDRGSLGSECASYWIKRNYNLEYYYCCKG